MEMNEYQKEAKKTAIYPNKGKNIYYPTLGLVGEAGEIANKIKKIMRDKKGKVDLATHKMLAYELGDVLWYVAALASELKIPLNNIAINNIIKLQKRKKQNKIKGNGDNR